MTQKAVADDAACPQDPVHMALAWHDGDALSTIATLLADCRHLRRQLALMEGVASRGMTRGWVPSYERTASLPFRDD